VPPLFAPTGLEHFAWPVLHVALNAGALQLLEALVRRASVDRGGEVYKGLQQFSGRSAKHMVFVTALLLAHCELPVAASFLASLRKALAAADAASPAGQVLTAVAEGVLWIPWVARLRPEAPAAAQPDAEAGAAAAAGAAQQQGAAVPAVGGAAAGLGVGEGGGAGRGGGEQAVAGPSGVSGGRAC
jgi:hypothetical protein